MKYQFKFLALLCALFLVIGCGGETAPPANGGDDGESGTEENAGEIEDPGEGAALEGADGTIKIGILHSLSGTMAISEVSLRDAVELAVEEINATGGVLGRQVETVAVDPASDWDLFAEKAKDLILTEKVAVTFGCWTSVSRKSRP